MKVLNKLVVCMENNIYGFSLSNPNMIQLYFNKNDFNQFVEKLLARIYTGFQTGIINQSYTTQLFNQMIAISKREIEKCKGSKANNSLDKEYIIERSKYYINLTEQKHNHRTL